MHEKKADLYHIKLNIDLIEHPYKSGNIYIYIYNVWKTSQRSILRGVGSLRYNDTIQVKQL